MIVNLCMCTAMRCDVSVGDQATSVQTVRVLRVSQNGKFGCPFRKLPRGALVEVDGVVRFGASME